MLTQYKDGWNHVGSLLLQQAKDISVWNRLAATDGTVDAAVPHAVACCNRVQALLIL